MTTQREKTWLIVFILFFLFLISFPVLSGFKVGGEEFVFAGYAFNPLDNNTYLAKMRQGYEGNWLFTLDYTPNPGEGVFLNGYYLFLGHVGRVTGIPLLWVQHLARLAGATALLLVLYRLSGDLFEENRARWLAFTLAALGSGSGWLIAPTGHITADLWVAEGYPFLASFANAHFPLGLALQLWLVLPLVDDRLDLKTGIKIFLASLAAAVVSPFSIPVVLVVLGGVFIWKWFEKTLLKTSLIRLILTGLGGGPLLVYYFVTIKTHPVLQLWDAQNITPSPPWWDILISFTPMLVLAVFGARRAWGDDRPAWRVMLGWAGLCLVLVYIPFPLQRRFLIGLFIPVTMLGVYGLDGWLKAAPKWRRSITAGVYLFTLLTTLLSLVTAFFGIAIQSPEMFLTRGEADALAWITENTGPDALVLSSSEMGNFIPAHTGRRVLYGHPFETVDAEVWEAAVDGFFGGEYDEVFLDENNVEYIFVGPRERELGDVGWLDVYKIVYKNDEIMIYKVGK